MNIGDSIRHGTKWLLAGSVGSRALNFGFGIVLARILVPADFGMLVTIGIFTGIVGFFAAGGMGRALVQAKEVKPADYDVVFTTQLTICVLIYLGFFAVAPWFSAWFNDPLYQPLLRLSALSFLIRPFLMAPQAYLMREMRFKQLSVFRIVSMTVSSCSSIAMALLGWGPFSLVFGGIAGSFTTLVLLRFVVQWRPRVHWDGATAKRLGSYGVMFSANEIIRYAKAQTANLLISRTLGASLVGLYNKAESLSGMPRAIILGSVEQAVFRGMASVQDDKDLSKYMFLRTITLVAVYTMPVYVGLWWLADPFIIAVYGQKWSLAAEPLRIFSITGMLLVAGTAGQLVEAQRRLGRELLLNVETGVVLVVSCFIGLKWGIVGVAWGMVVTRLYNNVRMYQLAKSIVDATYRDLVLALRSAYALNSILFGVLYGADRLGLGPYRQSHPGLYVLGMAAIGAGTYAVLFLTSQFPELRGEVSRWKKVIRAAAG